VAKLAAQNRRSLDQIASRCYYYHTLSHEAVGRLDTIHDFLHGRLRTATLSVSESFLLLKNYVKKFK
jgi:26S proteasome regulatory subunit N3